MEHEVFVPVAAERLREVLADPVRVARAVPGLQQDAGAEPVAGRLKLRVGGHTITYRGAVRVTARDDGAYAVEGDATEARGSGSVKLALTLRARDADGGTTLAVEGGALADGRITEFEADAVHAAVTRLLNRFAERLGAVAAESAGPEAAAEGVEEALAPGEFEPRVTSDFETTPDADDPPVPEPASVFDTEVPPPALDPEADTDTEPEEDDEDEGADGEAPVAEAAHARRTMIGRSAEEVDHAPPRGRYAPVPPPQSLAPNSALRWAAPAAAVVLASAIVAGRMLRRRR
ncbi:carbon monoxide dehydrogenase [Streptomyces sp. SS1-1]|uniref:SRPBCC domain-containing protein n=1 Tax=unclassified Streptomyces TaxID=2593676 RepID=UPI00124FC18F|nr:MULTISPECIES: SRPBCC domain-containing protein [unclassified Streptomyces]KAB2973906.1 carbon monoxide dehydrogenase [Streptomyces sp. SS1-1]MDI9832175.1 SRPBCC domain-containing protein [Streptomyces sp. KAU_LT]